MRRVPLTPRQVEVAILLADGLSYSEIGGRLHISHRTVEHHAAEIRRKTGAANNTAAVSRVRGREPGRALGPRSKTRG